MNQIQEIMNGMDVDKSGSVDYTEFLAATLGRNLYMQEERLHSAFKTFDKDGSGKISIDELRQVIGSENVPAEEVEELIREVDTNNDGEIDFNEFLKLMESKNSITN